MKNFILMLSGGFFFLGRSLLFHFWEGNFGVIVEDDK